jgi:polyisoprenyl-phosphate glycosyltransferase
MYNEEAGLADLFRGLEPIIQDIRNEFGFRVEVVINDNSSVDGTFAGLRAIAEQHDPALYDLRIFRFSKNIGFQNSILVGYRKARGDAVIQIDADLQDPPEIMLEFLRKWLEGYKVVYGVRAKRQEGIVISFLRRMFYRLIDKISEDKLPHDSGDFRLVDRALVDIVCQMQDFTPYLRGLIASLGCRQAGIPYDRAARVTGKSKFRLTDLLRLSFDGIANHSTYPLIISSYFALLIALGMLVLVFYYLYSWLAMDTPIAAGFMTQTLLQLGGVCVLSLFFAIQGAYLSRIYSQVKERPLAIVQDAIIIEARPEGGELLETENSIEVIWHGNER